MGSKTNGYWFFGTFPFINSCESLLNSNNRHQYRLPVNCENENYGDHPNCCYKERMLDDSRWISECCSHWAQAIEDHWNAIKSANLKF